MTNKLDFFFQEEVLIVVSFCEWNMFPHGNSLPVDRDVMTTVGLSNRNVFRAISRVMEYFECIVTATGAESLKIVEVWSLMMMLMMMMMIAPATPTHAAGCEGNTTGRNDFWGLTSHSSGLIIGTNNCDAAKCVHAWQQLCLEVEHRSRHFEVAVLDLRLLKNEFPGIHSDRWWGTSAQVYSSNWNELETTNFYCSQKVQNISVFWEVMTSVFCDGRVVHVEFLYRGTRIIANAYSDMLR